MVYLQLISILIEIHSNRQACSARIVVLDNSSVALQQNVAGINWMPLGTSVQYLLAAQL